MNANNDTANSPSPAPRPPRRRYSVRARLGLGLGAALAGLIAMELVARVWLHWFAQPGEEMNRRIAAPAEAPWTAYDPYLGWRNKPDAFVPNRFPTGDVRINDQGFRADRHVPRARPAGFHRILCVGDSFTFSYDVGNGLDWPAQLAHFAPNADGVNLGVCGYGLGQIVLGYEEAAPLTEHDLVVLGFFNWDVNRTINDYTVTGGFEHPEFRIAKRAGQEQVEWVRRRLPPPRPTGARMYGSFALERFLRVTLMNREMTLFQTRPASSESWRIGRLLLRRLKQSVQASGARLAAVDIPYFYYLDHPDVATLAYASEVFRQEAIPYLDLAPVFRERIRQEQLYITPEGGHCSPAGYRLIAEQTVQLLRAQGWMD